jgi:hypothetical protein
MATCKRVGLIALWALLFAPGASAQVGVSVQWLYPIESLYLADLSPYTVGAQPEFLSVLLTGGGSGQNVVLEVSLRMEQPTGVQIFTGTTDPFPLTGTARRLTNRDLACASCPYAIENGELSDDFADLVRESGRFPAGIYRLEVRALSPLGIEYDREAVTIELTNPTRIELVSPGTPFGDTPELLTNANPRFVWSSDGGPGLGGSEYRIRVVPVDGAASAEDAIQQFASWDATTNATQILYPGSVSAIPLEPGVTYVWQIVRQVRGSTGEELLSSPIYWFRMADAGSGGDDPSDRGGGGDVGTVNQLRQLARTLGFDLSGFRPTGQIFVNGEPYPADNLEELLRAIIAGDISIESITVR